MFRVAFLNMEQHHRRWDARRHLIADQLVALAPDVFAMNEISVPRQTGRWVQARRTTGCRTATRWCSRPRPLWARRSRGRG